jgi:hypothetical protein
MSEPREVNSEGEKMYKFTQIALFVMMLVIEAASNPALAVDQRNVAAGGKIHGIERLLR